VTVATAADGAAAKRPAAPMDKPKRLTVRSAVGVRISVGGWGESDQWQRS
jgi:hypothetical protein